MNVFVFICTACFWAGSFIAIKPLVMAMPPVFAGTLRIGVAIAFLSVLLPVIKVPLTVPRELRPRVWATGFFAFGFPFALLFWGEKSISPGLAGIFNGTVPVWVFILGALFTPGEESFSKRKILGLMFGFAGILAIFLPQLLKSQADSSLMGTFAVMLMAVCYACGVLMNRTLFKKYSHLHPFSNLYQQLWAGFVVIVLIATVTEGLPRPSEWSPISTVIWAELYLGCVSTSLAFLMFYRLIRNWGSVRAATVTYVVPAIALILDMVLNGTVPSYNQIAGVCAVTFGVVVLNAKKPLVVQKSFLATFSKP